MFSLRSGYNYVFSVVVAIATIFGMIYITMSSLSDITSGLIRMKAPGDKEVHLDAGGYILFYEHQSLFEGKSYFTGNLGEIECQIVNTATQETIELQSTGARSSYAYGSYAGESLFGFNIAKAGTYKISMNFDNSDYKSVIFAVGSDNIVSSIIMVVVMILGGMFILLLCLILLILTIIYRRKPVKVLEGPSVSKPDFA